jgi:hypothetical protein
VIKSQRMRTQHSANMGDKKYILSFSWKSDGKKPTDRQDNSSKMNLNETEYNDVVK